ncbi:MAG: site-2 protease family protein [Clostridia bacterium]|nr:site-2 protease family protein [Clostridia bacterium]
MLTYIESFFSDPVNTLVIFLLAFPGRILALSAHEFAHAWVAHRCGDDTAKVLGRMTLNPFKHLDPLGTVLMLVVGFGWAKPVPVNPRNFRNYRQDDLKVSLAGVTMNLILFILAMVAMFFIAASALARVPAMSASNPSGLIFRADYMGRECLFALEGDSYFYVPLKSLLQMLPYASDYLIKPVFGEVPGYLYQMLGYFAMTNLVLCLFNLLPVPPLDGYHVLNDLVLHRNLFADPRTARIASSVLFVLVMTGAVGRVLGWVDTQVLKGAGNLAALALRAMGLMN